jgi:hypothetical protein
MSAYSDFAKASEFGKQAMFEDTYDRMTAAEKRVKELEAYVQAAYEWFGNFCVHAPIQFGGEIEMGMNAEALLKKVKS